MPSFSQIEITTTVDVDFEVFCSCGAYMCGETDTRNSRNRNTPQAVVNACQRCIEDAKEPLEDRIEELQQLLAEAREENERLSECHQPKLETSV
jgi:hypothetical protein